MDGSGAAGYRGRLAPSPTGLLHLGHARTFWTAQERAEAAGGTLILRNDDLDRSRCRPEFAAAMLEDLRWFGLRWSEGPDCGGPHAPYRQSERAQHYLDHAGILLETGKAYRCFCTQERLAKVRLQQQAEKKTGGYDRHCRDLDPHEATNRAAHGESHTIRLKAPLEGTIVVKDQLRGDISIDAGQCGGIDAAQFF